MLARPPLINKEDYNMFNIINWLWPQWTLIILWAMALLMEAALHDKPKTGKHNIGTGILRVAFAAWIFISGGFFK